MKHETVSFNLDDVDCRLGSVRELLILHSDYFMYSREKIEREPWQFICKYEQQSACQKSDL
jgi:hypothetical protein